MLEVTPIDRLVSESKFPADAYVFVKCFGSKAIILAAHLHGLGKQVGHDLFDDYFSQYDDARLAYYRGWLSLAAAHSDFVVCTTERMREVAERYFPSARVLMAPDPYLPFDAARLAARLTAKTARMDRSKHIQAVWFGIGDNPFFHVGLHDLAAHAGDLARVRRLGWQVELKVLTNSRALSADGLALLRAIPLPVTIEEWSEAAEIEVLGASDVAFLPVSGQSFSRAKSLNRAVTALCAGCQVLNAGYPLYAELDEVVLSVGRHATA